MLDLCHGDGSFSLLNSKYEPDVRHKFETPSWLNLTGYYEEYTPPQGTFWDMGGAFFTRGLFYPSEE